MKKFAKKCTAIAALALASAAGAANVDVTADISGSETWTANNVYNLVGRIHVLPGASLSIEAGTVIATVPNANQGTLAVCRGGQIFVNGTADAPVIMTSSNDVATWDVDATHPTGHDPKSGTWRAACQEWGNLTIMGNGLISASDYGDPSAPVVIDGRPNSKMPDGMSQKRMEGLVATVGQEDLVRYGGNNDNDDSGSIHYLSIRYGGKVLIDTDELNGLSLGAIGRETDIDHVEIMNNVDDGIEIWGGAVNLKYVSIWNIGDDSFDIDEGWRGKAQFGLIVQGYSGEAKQGSGFGDNVFETDGAEDSDAQPVTTAAIYNFTAVGNPYYEGLNTGDGGTVWRDGARIQYRNCIWMDLGDKLVKFDNSDGDGGRGYGGADSLATPHYQTLSWGGVETDSVWMTPASHSHNYAATINHMDPMPAAGAFNDVAVLYQSQDLSGMLAEITDSVFYNIPRGLGDAPVDLSDAAYGNVLASSMPIRGLTRGTAVAYATGGKNYLVQPVVSIDPRAANDATVSNATAPVDGFFTAAPFRGGFSADSIWLKGWSAADAFGMITDSGYGSPETPEGELALTATTSFESLAGVVYTVEASSDMVNWSPIGTVVGNGETMSVTDLDMFDSAKFYRVIVQ